MDIPTIPDILARIEGFCERHAMTESRFGRDALNNPALVSGLRAGGNPTLQTLERIAAFIEARDAEADHSPGSDKKAAA
jgi:hypothetical protein